MGPAAAFLGRAVWWLLKTPLMHPIKTALVTGIADAYANKGRLMKWAGGKAVNEGVEIAKEGANALAEGSSKALSDGFGEAAKPILDFVKEHPIATGLTVLGGAMLMRGGGKEGGGIFSSIAKLAIAAIAAFAIFSAFKGKAANDMNNVANIVSSESVGVQAKPGSLGFLYSDAGRAAAPTLRTDSMGFNNAVLATNAAADKRPVAAFESITGPAQDSPELAQG